MPYNTISNLQFRKHEQSEQDICREGAKKIHEISALYRGSPNNAENATSNPSGERNENEEFGGDEGG